MVCEGIVALLQNQVQDPTTTRRLIVTPAIERSGGIRTREQLSVGADAVLVGWCRRQQDIRPPSPQSDCEVVDGAVVAGLCAMLKVAPLCRPKSVAQLYVERWVSRECVVRLYIPKILRYCFDVAYRTEQVRSACPSVRALPKSRSDGRYNPCCVIPTYVAIVPP